MMSFIELDIFICKVHLWINVWIGAKGLNRITLRKDSISEVLLQMFNVWLFKFSLLSRVTPRGVTSGTGFLKILFISTEKLSGMVFSPRIMTWHFSGFISIKLSLNQSIIRKHCDSVKICLNQRLTACVQCVIICKVPEISRLLPVFCP